MEDDSLHAFNSLSRIGVKQVSLGCEPVPHF
jgi:hypothetical protein